MSEIRSREADPRVGGGWWVEGTGQRSEVRDQMSGMHRELELKNYQRHDY